VAALRLAVFETSLGRQSLPGGNLSRMGVSVGTERSAKRRAPIRI
jgi:hypothetical protein